MAETPSSQFRSTLVPRGDAPAPIKVGLRLRPLSDLYHFLMKTSWTAIFLLVLGGYVLLNVGFALVYLRLGPEAIENARAGDFGDAFFFSVQTLATIGYGKLVPRSGAANLVVTLEALVGLLALAMTTGIVFSRFARARARVLFSRCSVVTSYDGKPAFMFRMANERGNQIAEATIHATLLRSESLKEGTMMRRQYDLDMVRTRSIVFVLTWTAIHVIDERSPLHGETPESLARGEVEVIVAVNGFDETVSSTIHARHSYLPDEIHFGARLADILTRLPDGRRKIDYTRFHQVEPVPDPGQDDPTSGRPSAERSQGS
jgi:inward rectifier potassium channel